jgi:hypothetical protein
MNNLIILIENRIKLDKNGIGNGNDIYNPNNPKLLFYSAHDHNLSALEVFLKFVFPNRVKELYNVPYASEIKFEVYRINDLNFTKKNINKSKRKKLLKRNKLIEGKAFNISSKLTLDKNNDNNNNKYVNDIEMDIGIGINDEDNYELNIFFNDNDLFNGAIKFSEFKKGILANNVPQSEINNFCEFDDTQKSESKINMVISLLLIAINLGLLIGVFKIYGKKNAENDTESKITIDSPLNA